jgi:hypothetical protein
MGGCMKTVPGMEKITVTLNVDGEVEIVQTGWNGEDDSPAIVIPVAYLGFFIKALEEVAAEAQG